VSVRDKARAYLDSLSTESSLRAPEDLMAEWAESLLSEVRVEALEQAARVLDGQARQDRNAQAQLGIKNPGSPVVVSAAVCEDAARALRALKESPRGE
jgi:hypothetical protein